MQLMDEFVGTDIDEKSWPKLRKIIEANPN
jgi:hypothetical protein